MRASRFAAFVLLSVPPAALLGACSSGRSTAAPPVGGSGGAIAASAPPPATTSTAPPTTTYSPGAPQASPDAAGARLMDAWSARNAAEAASVAAPTAVATLFGIPFPTDNLQARGCTDGTTNPGTCTYRNTDNNDIYEVTVQHAPGGWYVTAVTPES